MSFRICRCNGCKNGFIGTEKIVDYYDYVSIQALGCNNCGYDNSLLGEKVASGDGVIPEQYRDKIYQAGTLAAYGPLGESCDTDMFGTRVGSIQRQPPKRQG